MKDYAQLASDQAIAEAIKNLASHGIEATVVPTREEAREEVLKLISQGAEVMTMTSVTLAETGIADEINESGHYNSVRKIMAAMDKDKEKRQMKALAAAPEYAIGSVHAITQDGTLVIASNTGSQLPAYVYGADKVIFVAGAQKIVPDLATANERLYQYVLPLEAERAKKAYGAPGSNVSKLLLIHKEVVPNRIHLIIVKEKLGF